jgi:hypothetical protein
MDNSMNKDRWEKYEEIALIIIAFAGLLFMVVYWR